MDANTNVSDRGNVDSRAKNSKGAIGRNVATAAITNDKQGMMGASVYIADEISVVINFNF